MNSCLAKLILGVQLTAFLVPVPPKAPQDRDTPIIRVRSEMILIDLIPTDREGGFISDLGREEVRIRDGGEPQAILYFEKVGAIEEAPGDGPSKPAGRPVARPEDRLQDTLAVLAFAFDLTSLPSSALKRAKDSLRSFVEQAGDDALFTIVAFDPSPHVITGLTSDRTQLAAGVESLQSSGEGQIAEMSIEHVLSEMERDLGPLLSGRIQPRPDQLADTATLAPRRYLQEHARRFEQLMESTAAWLTSFNGIAGRKSAVLYSAGYPLRPREILDRLIWDELSPHFNMKLDGDLRMRISRRLGGAQRDDPSDILNRVIDRASRAQVALYTIDARGLAAVQGSGDAQHQSSRALSRSGQLENHIQSGITAPQELLVTLAKGTGGLAFLNHNDLSRGARQAYLDSRQFYRIGYAPKNPGKDGEYREVEVKVARSGVSLRHQKGYLRTSDSRKLQTLVEAALSYPELYHGYTVRPTVKSSRGKEVDLEVAVPVSALQFEEVRGRHRCKIEIAGGAFDTSGRMLEKRLLFSKAYELDLEAEQLAMLQQRENVTSLVQASLPKGTSEVRIAVVQGTQNAVAAGVAKVP